MAIILYDLVSSCREIAWSPNTRKARFSLNFKGVPYKTEWVEWPDIQGIYEKHVIQATSSHPDGSPRYTLPVIYDPSTGVAISDSFLIAEYLDKTYPTTQQIFPLGTQGLQAAFEASYLARTRPMVPFVIPDICNILTPVSQAVYIPQREKMFGMTMEELRRQGAVDGWKKYEDGLGEVAQWYTKTDGPFLMGNTISWADFIVVSPMLLFRALGGEESIYWKDIITWHEGVWGNLIRALDKYTSVV